MQIIIEGPDRVGKSTLAKILAIQLGCGIVHSSKPKTQDPYVEYVDMLRDLSAQHNVILDRGYHGEYVYANLWRGGCKITPEQFRQLDTYAAKSNTIVIHAFASAETILKRCQLVGEDLLKPEQIQRCLDLFEDIVSKTTLPVYKYDSDVYSPEQFFETIRPVIKKLREKPYENFDF